MIIFAFVEMLTFFFGVLGLDVAAAEVDEVEEEVFETEVERVVPVTELLAEEAEDWGC